MSNTKETTEHKVGYAKPSPSAINSPLSIPIWILTALAVCYVAQVAAAITLWILLSFFLFAFLDPLMQKLSRKGISPILSALGLISLVSLACVGLVMLVVHFSAGMTADIGAYRKTLMHLYHSVTGTLNQQLHDITASGAAPKPPANPDVAQVEVVDKSPLDGGVGESLMHGIGSVFTVVVFGFLIPILTFFLITERKAMAAVFSRAFRDENGDDKRAGLVWSKITEAAGAYFFGNLVLGVISFPVFCGVFWAFGITPPFALAGLASVFNLIPFLGAILSGLLPVLGLLTSQHATTGSIIGLILSCAAIHFTFANLVTPKILGSKLDLNATTSTIALVAFGELLGGIGLLLAIPIAATVKILFQFSENASLQWIAMLMSDDAESLLRKSARFVTKNASAKK